MESKTQGKNILLAIIGLVAVSLTAAIIGWLVLGKDDEAIQGEMEVTEYRVSSKIATRILRFYVNEGDHVKAGDTLVVLEAPDMEAKLKQAKSAQSAARAMSEKEDNGTRSEQVMQAHEMWQKAQAGLDIARRTYERMERLFQESVISEQKRDEAKAQYDAARAQADAAKAQYDMAMNGSRKEDKAAARAQLERAENAVDEVQSYMNETVLLAAADGEVTEIFPEMGELVGAGAPIMNIGVMDDMWATFNVREDLLKGLTVGEEITAYSPALDRDIQMRTTYMKDIGDFAAWKATKTRGDFDLRTFEVKARPIHKEKGLRPGMSMIIKR